MRAHVLPPMPASECLLRLTTLLVVAVYTVVVRKQAERIALQADAPQEPSFGEVLKQQWEEKQKELQQASGKE